MASVRPSPELKSKSHTKPNLGEQEHKVAETMQQDNAKYTPSLLAKRVQYCTAAATPPSRFQDQLLDPFSGHRFGGHTPEALQSASVPFYVPEGGLPFCLV